MTAVSARPTVMDLHYAPGSSALVILLALEEAGAVFRLRTMNLAAGDQHRRDFLALNPMGRVPVLVDGDFVLTEIGAILRYVALRHPDAELWPDDIHAQARCAEWLAWCASALHPAMAHVRKPMRYAETPEAQAEVVSCGRRTVRDLFGQAEARLGRSTWAAGDRFSVADLYLLFFWQWSAAILDDDRVANTFPVWKQLSSRLAARPAVARVIAQEGVVLP